MFEGSSWSDESMVHGQAKDLRGFKMKTVIAELELDEKEDQEAARQTCGQASDGD